jgi:hypothetical protein
LFESVLDVVAECERELWRSRDNPRFADHRYNGLECSDDLVATRSGRERVRDGMLERRRCRTDGDGGSQTYERGGFQPEFSGRQCTLIRRELTEERVVVKSESAKSVSVVIHLAWIYLSITSPNTPHTDWVRFREPLGIAPGDWLSRPRSARVRVEITPTG